MLATLPTTLESGELAVVTHGLTKRFGKDEALRGVDLQVPLGSVYVLVGPNGAGKTTTLRILLDLVRADSGTAEVFGLDPRERGADVRAQIGYVGESHEWGFGHMRVGRMMQHHARFYPTWDPEYAATLVRAFEIEPDRKYGKLSKGQSRRVQLVTALAHRPPLLLLDEPTDGLDPVARDETLGILAEHIAGTGATLLVSTHLVHELDRLSDHVGVMRAGRLVAQTPRAVLHRMLRRYRADVPDGWAGAPGLNGAVVKRSGIGREIQWSVWGDEHEVVEMLNGSGATVRDATPLTLEDAALALLSRKEQEDAIG